METEHPRCFQDELIPVLTKINLDYSRVEANPPHPDIKVEEVAHEVWFACRVKDADNKN